MIEAVQRAIHRLDSVPKQDQYIVHDRMYPKSEARQWLGVSSKTLENIPFSELPYIQHVPRGERKYRGRDIRAYIKRRFLAQAGNTYTY